MVNNGNATQHGSKIIIDSPATLSAILAWRRPLSVEKDKAGIAAGLVLFWSQILAGIDAGLVLFWSQILAGIAAGLVLFWSQILAGIDAGLLFLRLRKG